MKRVLWVLCAAAVACVAASTGVAGSGSASTITAKRVCTTGQIRCLAMVAVSPAGRVVAAARPSALPSGLTPAQLRTAYGLPAKAASPATVAIVDAYDYESAYSDLTAYSKAVGLPVMPHCTKAVTVSCFQKVNLGAGANSAVSKGWDVEIALDIEAVHAVCQNCKIVLVEAAHTDLASFVAAERSANGLADIVSNSWGLSPADGSLGTSNDSAFSYPGHAIVVSAGDDGYEPSYPATLNTVISVGGTSLRVGSDGTYRGESVWSGSGSGCAAGTIRGATRVAPAAFQKAAAGVSSAGCPTGVRGDNDVAAVADPHTGLAVYVKRSGWLEVGGTSLSAPLIAGIYALAGDVGSTKLPAASLYAHLGNTSAFRDVTTGSNEPSTGCDGVVARCTARRGYDLPTGVGTPHGISGF
jgi:subtilase family serine protease